MEKHRFFLSTPPKKDNTMKKTEFQKALEKCVNNDRSKGIAVREITQDLGFSCPTSLRYLLRTGGCSQEVGEAIIRRWPSLTPYVDLDAMRPCSRLISSKKKKSVIEAAPPLPPGDFQPAAPVNMFALGASFYRLAQRPEAPMWIEKLEAACRAGIPFQQAVAELKSTMTEVTRG